MDTEKKQFRKMFPKLADEIEDGECNVKIDSVRPRSKAGDKTGSTKFKNYDPGVIDFLRRCDKAEQAEEIICYLEKRNEISCEDARKLRKQLKEKGVRSFGSKKADDYYLKEDGF
ncbi:MAG: DUF2095 family protein [Candidatus Bathyarchaeia archaeon]|jgi:hypothetical protein